MNGIQCVDCGFAENSPRAQFCGMCTQPLPLLCAECGALNPRDFRFCSQCAVALNRSVGLASTRRVVTVLFVDVCNSTMLTSELGPERMYGLLDPFLRRLGETIQRFEGTIDKIMGDGIMAVFGMPVALEQHAIQSAYAALAIFDELQRYNEQLREQAQIIIQLRIGISTGEVVAGKLGSDRASDRTVVGEVVNLAARLQQHAQPNTVLVNEATSQLVEPLFVLEAQPSVMLKGYTEPIHVWELVNKRDNPGLLRGLSGMRTPFIGRSEELQQLIDTMLMLENSMGGVVFLAGEAGIGKSRLSNELLEALRGRDIAVYEGDCASSTRIVPYSAFMGVIRDMCQLLPSDQLDVVHQKLVATVLKSGIADPETVVPFLEYVLSINRADSHGLSQISHFEPAQLKEQVFRAFRELLGAMARQQPVLLMLDDLQWADVISIELIESLVDLIDSTPLVLYLIARDDATPVLERLHAEIIPKAAQRGTQLSLTRLSRRDLQKMMRLLVPYASDTVVQQFAQYADGVPFYLEELVRHSLEVGVDLQTRDSHGLQVNQVPMSLEALLRARYDRLPPLLQHTLALAATIGRRFSVALLQHLDNAPALMQRLEQLRERALIHPRRSVPDEWTFFHMLMQETVYKSLLLEDRQQIHGQIARTIEATAGDRLAEQIETLAFHYAHSMYTEQAIKYNLQAAHRAVARYANDDALRYYALVDQLVAQAATPDRRALIEMHAGRAHVLTVQGRYAEARDDCFKGLELLPQLDAAAKHLEAELQRRLAQVEEKQGRYQQALHCLEQARIALGDGSLLEHAEIDAEAGWLAFLLGDLDAAERLLQTALTTAELYQHIGLQMRTLNRLAGASWRRGNLQKASTLVSRSLLMSRKMNDLAAVARALNNLGILAVDQAQWEEAETHYTQSMQAYIAIGNVGGQIQTAINQSNPMLMLGKFDAALGSLRMAYSLARQVGDPLHMAFALFNQGRISLFAEEFKRARTFFLEAEWIYRSIGGHQDNRSDIAEHLARIAWLEGRSAMAWSLCKRAERLARQTDDSKALFCARRLHAFLLAHAGDVTEACMIIDALNEATFVSATEHAWLALVEATIMELDQRYAAAEKARLKAERLFDATRIAPILRQFL